MLLLVKLLQAWAGHCWIVDFDSCIWYRQCKHLSHDHQHSIRVCGFPSRGNFSDAL